MELGETRIEVDRRPKIKEMIEFAFITCKYLEVLQ